MTNEMYPLTDIDLARRLERAEAIANAAFVEAHAALAPQLGAAWIDVGGAYAMFHGPDSPITQTFGLGLFDSIGETEFTWIETFFHSRGAAVHNEVCPMIGAETLGLLNGRGYKPVEFSNVLVRPTEMAGDRTTRSISVRRITAAEVPLWSKVAAAGWSSESAELATVVENFGQVMGSAQGAHCFLAFSSDRPIAAAGLVLNADVALLAGASTIPEARQQGAQLALLHARLEYAGLHGASLAMTLALPGSGSQRNAERQGFRTVYTRTKWRLTRGEA